jgi:hypothetical protein
MKPISPKEAQDLKNRNLPSEVIEAFNELIAQDFNGTTSTVSQKEVVALIKKKLKTEFKDHYLNVEPLFEDHGWKVVYDKPGYNEDYDATFEFRVVKPLRGKLP